MDIVVTDQFVATLQELNIFQKRTGMSRRKGIGHHAQRWSLGDKLSFADNCVIEEYSTLDCGNVLYSAGAFASCASPLPLGSSVGRYGSIADAVGSMGFRHPIESVTMSSASFNFRRENIHSYFKNYQEENNISLKLKAVPRPQPHRKPLKIGVDVWIGEGAILKGGVDIGNGSVVAGGALISRDVPAYSIVGGVPAKLLRERFPQEIFSELERLQWWKYELGDLYKMGMDFSKPELFIKQFYERLDEIRFLNVRRFSPFLYSCFNRHEEPVNNILYAFDGRVLLYDHMAARLILEVMSDKKLQQEVVCLGGNLSLKVGDKYLVKAWSGGKAELSDTENNAVLKFEKDEIGGRIVRAGKGGFLSFEKNGRLVFSKKRGATSKIVIFDDSILC